jgi:hypothetical protein
MATATVLDRPGHGTTHRRLTANLHNLIRLTLDRPNVNSKPRS